MKITKLALLALSFGLFATSCGDNNADDATTEDTTMNTMMEPATPVTPDTMMAAPATTDTTMNNSGTMNSGSTTDTMKK